tara:strand:- start:647 stop:3034 length:2388 start_codon:yes stop_codon:yes gene_type:complete
MHANSQSTLDNAQLYCTHCDEPALAGIISRQDESKVFCCVGCRTVYEVLNNIGLDEYYDIKEQSGVIRRRAPVQISEQQYLFLDHDSFLKDYAEKSDGILSMDFYLEGIHCLACLWLIEKLPELIDCVVNSKLDMEKSVVTISITDQAESKFSLAAKKLSQLGYRPHPLKKNQSIKKLKQKEERSYLLKTGIAAAGASNVMIYAVSNYAGASDSYANIFNLLTIVFAIPVLFYSASPFYKNALRSLQNKTISIDLPISVALIAGTFYGFWNVIHGVHENYFDSLTTLVFLLLLSRYFLKKIQEKALSSRDFSYFYMGDSVKRVISIEDMITQEIHPDFVAKDDYLLIAPGDFIPADSVIINGQSHINNSLLTGESEPQRYEEQDQVFAGTQNISNQLLIQVKHTREDTRVGKILKSVEEGWTTKAPIVLYVDKISKVFMYSILILVAILFVKESATGGLSSGFEAALTLLIVTCPCALALATPLAFTRSLEIASSGGAIIKNDSVLQKLSEVENVFIDKTGTLTIGQLVLKRVDNFSKPNEPIENILFSLCKQSTHPKSRAISYYCETLQAKELVKSKYSEIPGRGISALIDGHYYRIDRDRLFKNEKMIAVLTFVDQIRADTATSVQSLKQDKYSVSLISGDHRDICFSVGEQAGIDESNIFTEVMPETKNKIIKSHKNSMMVGDGANDAIALSQAHVGVAVLGAMDISLKAADIYMSEPGIGRIRDVLILGKETMSVIKRNLVFSLIYNLVTIVGVFAGVITPLIGAIIMPLSSLTVLLSTYMGTKRMRALWK